MAEEEKSEREQAIDFLQGMRGQYIVGQALHVAIKAMESIPEERRESSNIADMKFLRDNLFGMYSAVAAASGDE